MDLLIVFLAGWSIFATANSDFFNKVEEQKSKGYEWVYTGKQYWNNEGPAILIESHKGTKPRYYWRIGELEDRKVK
mgnify:CR=1 FL=1|tara:strand:+ start:711 stop:938 length:228 start_codon:yes stop_codon:yes gene_type:complete